MRKKKKKICCPLCLINYLHWEATGKVLPCEKCPFVDRCEKYRAAKDFREIT